MRWHVHKIAMDRQHTMAADYATGENSSGVVVLAGSLSRESEY